MTDFAQTTTDALTNLRARLTSTFDGKNGGQTIDHVYLNAQQHVVIEGVFPDEATFHSVTGRTADEMLQSLDNPLA